MVGTNIFTRVVYELVIRTTSYFPVTGKSGMWDNEVTRSVAINISYFVVVEAGPMTRRRLGIRRGPQ